MYAEREAPHRALVSLGIRCNSSPVADCSKEGGIRSFISQISTIKIFGAVAAVRGRTPIFVDNESAVAVALDDASMKRSLYLIRRIWFLQELVTDGEVLPVACAGKYNLADPLTKLQGFTKADYAAWRTRIFGRTDAGG